MKFKALVVLMLLASLLMIGCGGSTPAPIPTPTPTPTPTPNPTPTPTPTPKPVKKGVYKPTQGSLSAKSQLLQANATTELDSSMVADSTGVFLMMLTGNNFLYGNMSVKDDGTIVTSDTVYWYKPDGTMVDLPQFSGTVVNDRLVGTTSAGSFDFQLTDLGTQTLDMGEKSTIYLSVDNDSGWTACAPDQTWQGTTSPKCGNIALFRFYPYDGHVGKIVGNTYATLEDALDAVKNGYDPMNQIKGKYTSDFNGSWFYANGTDIPHTNVLVTSLVWSGYDNAYKYGLVNGLSYFDTNGSMMVLMTGNRTNFGRWTGKLDPQ